MTIMIAVRSMIFFGVENMLPSMDKIKLGVKSATDSGDFSQLRRKSIGVWSEKYSGSSRSLISLDLIEK